MTRLHIAVAARDGGDLDRFVHHLEAQGIAGHSDTEVRIAHNGSLAPRTLPDNVTLHACAADTSIFRLWGAALARSRCAYTAVLEISCPPTGNWFRRVRAEIEAGTPVFFGPVTLGWEPSDRRSVGYVVEYAQFMPPLPESLVEVPGNNFVCKRTLLDTDEALEQTGFAKTFLVWRLEREHGLRPEPKADMPVTYFKPLRAGAYIKRRALHGRVFAARRMDAPQHPPRLACIGFTPLLPALRVWRIFRAVRPHPPLRRSFFRFLLLILGSEIAWSFGELWGYVFGASEACERRLG